MAGVLFRFSGFVDNLLFFGPLGNSGLLVLPYVLSV